MQAVAAHEGWWDATDGIPRDGAMAIFEDPARAPVIVAARDLSGQVALMRALLEVSLATITAAQGHPAYAARRN